MDFSWDFTVFWTTGLVDIDRTTCSGGVFVVLIAGEVSILSNGSYEEVLPVLVNFSDWSRRIVDGEFGCKTGVCLDCFDGISFDDRLEIIFVDVESDDRIGSDCGVENFSFDTCWSILGVVLPFTPVDIFFDERCFFSSFIPGILSPSEKLLDELIRGLEGNRGTGETGGESKCWDFENPLRVV